jgi:hypothetical protein
MSLAALLLTATVAAEPPVLNPPDIQALAKRFAAREASLAASSEASACRLPSRVPTAEAADDRRGAKKLGELPPHRHYMTVLRKERGCDVAVVKEDGRNVVVPLGPQQGLQRLDKLALAD